VRIGVNTGEVVVAYLEPFALRALAIVHDDNALLGQALEQFAALELDWHAAQTDALGSRP
jgi:hypothetical protein